MFQEEQTWPGQQVLQYGDRAADSPGAAVRMDELFKLDSFVERVRVGLLAAGGKTPA